MSISHPQIALVQESFRRLRDDLEPASLMFYEELFRRDPDLRKMFRDDLAGQGMKFMSTLGLIVDSLDNVQTLEARFTHLGQGHAMLGVKAGHFSTMREALIHTLRETLQESFNDDVETAWREAYDLLAQAIITKGQISDKKE